MGAKNLKGKKETIGNKGAFVEMERGCEGEGDRIKKKGKREKKQFFELFIGGLSFETTEGTLRN